MPTISRLFYVILIAAIPSGVALAETPPEEIIFDLPINPGTETSITLPSQAPSAPQQGPALFFFASQSIQPETILRTWADAKRLTQLPVITILRGNGGIDANLLLQRLTGLPKPDDLVKQHIMPVWLDPILFRQYNISHVPAWVLVDKFDSADPHRSPKRAWKLTGDAKLREVLEHFQRGTAPHEFPELQAAAEELRPSWIAP